MDSCSLAVVDSYLHPGPSRAAQLVVFLYRPGGKDSGFSHQNGTGPPLRGLSCTRFAQRKLSILAVSESFFFISLKTSGSTPSLLSSDETSQGPLLTSLRPSIMLLVAHLSPLTPFPATANDRRPCRAYSSTSSICPYAEMA